MSFFRATRPPRASGRTHLVRYLGASGYRRFQGKKSGDISVPAQAWLAIIAAAVLVLMAIGGWREVRGPVRPPPSSSATPTPSAPP